MVAVYSGKRCGGTPTAAGRGFSLVEDRAGAEGSSDGMPFAQLEDRVRAYLTAKNVPPELFPKPGSVRWYCKAVQLDLEAKGLIERLPKRSPIQLRKTEV
jgi:hypothetical protein